MINKMRALDMAGGRFKTWVAAFAVWTMIGVISHSRGYPRENYRGDMAEDWAISLDYAICYFVWAALTPLILALAHRFPLAGPRRLRNLSLHAFISLLLAPAIVGLSIGVLQLTIQSLIGRAPSGAFWETVLAQRLRQTFKAGLVLEVLIYWMIVCAGHALEYYRRQREREISASQLEARASQMEASLRQAQLDTLRMQIHPHFLFNTLNTISVLMREDVEAADRLLILLSELLRAAIRNERQEVPLRQELDFINRYLEIEQTRFRDRLRTRIEVDPAALDALAPTLILQPLVENAIKHGVAKRSKAGLIEIGARRDGDLIELRVRDDGPGLVPSKTTRETHGVGIANTRARLQQLYQTAFRFELQNIETGGLMVTVAFPFKTCHVEGTIQLQSSDRRR